MIIRFFSNLTYKEESISVSVKIDNLKCLFNTREKPASLFIKYEL